MENIEFVKLDTVDVFVREDDVCLDAETVKRIADDVHRRLEAEIWRLITTGARDITIESSPFSIRVVGTHYSYSPPINYGVVRCPNA